MGSSYRDPPPRHDATLSPNTPPVGGRRPVPTLVDGTQHKPGAGSKPRHHEENRVCCVRAGRPTFCVRTQIESSDTGSPSMSIIPWYRDVMLFSTTTERASEQENRRFVSGVSLPVPSPLVEMIFVWGFAKTDGPSNRSWCDDCDFVVLSNTDDRENWDANASKNKP